jgi:hypothetical protein
MSADILCVDFKTKSKAYTRNPPPVDDAVTAAMFASGLDTPVDVLMLGYPGVFMATDEELKALPAAESDGA